MKDIFDIEIANETIDRINKLNHESQPEWGKMSVAQMFAHCNVTYEMVYTDKHKPAKGFKRFMLNMFIKGPVVNEKPYKKNSRTAPQFIISDPKVFEDEKKRLVNHITKTQELGREYFDGKESNSFGKLSAQEWNNSFYKHIDHHLNQFGV